jgi:hypothetical protein
MATEENTRWLNDKIQFARLLCEINAALDSLDCELLANVTTSMDLGISDIKELFARADKAWEHAKKIAEEPEVICGDCGSENVEYVAWYNPTTEEVGESFGTFNYGDNSYCNECDDHKDIIFKGDNPEKFKELREKHLTRDCKTDTEKDDEEEAPQAS